MTAEATALIGHDRVRLWVNRNKREKLVVTPVVMLSVGHAEHAGRLIINTVEAKDLSDEKVLLLLQGAVEVLRAQIAGGN